MPRTVSLAGPAFHLVTGNSEGNNIAGMARSLYLEMSDG